MGDVRRQLVNATRRAREHCSERRAEDVAPPDCAPETLFSVRRRRQAGFLRERPRQSTVAGIRKGSSDADTKLVLIHASFALPKQH